MSKLDVRWQSRAWDRFWTLTIQLREFYLMLACIFLKKLARATNRTRDLRWAHAYALVSDRTRPIEGCVHIDIYE